MIFFHKNQIYEMVSMAEAIDAMKEAFIQLSRGEAFVPQRASLNIPDKNATCLVMPAYAMGSPYYSVKTVSINYSNPDKGLPLIHAVVQVFDAEKGNLVATLDGKSITAIRTAAASGLATDLLAKQDAKVCAIFGTGVQAKSHLEAMMVVRKIEKFIIISRKEESANRFIESQARDIAIEIGTKESIFEADIICTTTPSQSPLFNHENIKNGCHINVVGSHQADYREVPTETVMKSKVVIDSLEACKKEAGDLLIPVQEGKWNLEKLHGELGQIASGEILGRESDKEITLFKSVGIAIQDLAMANLIMEKV